MAKGSHSRLILTVLLALALGIAAYVAYSVNWYRQDRVARRADECLALSRMADKAALAFVDRYVALFQGVARVQAVQRHDAAASSELFRELSTAFPACENIAATGIEGCFFASARPLTNSTPCISSREFFQRLASGAPLAVMQPHQGPITGELVTGVVVPIPGKDGRFEGIVGASIAFSAIERPLGRTGRIFRSCPGGLRPVRGGSLRFRKFYLPDGRRAERKGGAAARHPPQRRDSRNGIRRGGVCRRGRAIIQQRADHGFADAQKRLAR